ncbi:putative transcriptional regulator [Acetitomaculum ruminis DSM 5522]|uniref:Putative transcriptional regulator n=1 Tax=Acetitomaculum ruminis DSM 5522 TaxID=1120918 RepID=A0A1I0WLQ9_9FIRM|nr:helix-turn-helix transcriptional regulator [Acetitomaculum ruminis]SFA89128.1 putative transcriptional regulator [Acetitomaculum ruminis DSM 5522]
MKNKLKEYRNKKKMTQKQLAKDCNVTSRSIISIEKGDFNPCLLLAYKISRVLDISMEELFCLEENSLDEIKKGEGTLK